jgi:hypothetical protein
MTRIFQILAVILLGVAAIFFWKANSDWAFACGVLAACSYFLSVRFQFKGRIDERKAKSSLETEDDPDETKV